MSSTATPFSNFDSPTHKNTPHTTMSLEDTLLKLVEAVNRQAAATEKQNELIAPKLVSFNPEPEPPVQNLTEQAVEARKPRTQKPKPEPTPEPEVETTAEPEPTQTIPPTGPIPVTMTPEQYRVAIREAVRPKIAGSPDTKAKWAALLVEWKVKNINDVEVGDLPDFLEQAKAL